MINFNRIVSLLTDRYGISLIAESGKCSEGIYVDFIPADLEKSEGFVIHVNIGWRSITADFIPGKFSALLIKTMGEAAPEKRETFKSFAGLAVNNNGQLTMKINNTITGPFDEEKWGRDWKRFDLSLKYLPVIFDSLSDIEAEDYIFKCAGNLLGMVLSLLPLSETDCEADASNEGLPEGALMRVEVNKYERSRLNRAACIEAKGTICEVCEFDFHKVFGEVGEGFIHVHHIVPVSQIGKGYIINPVKDLSPVCPNCHSMLHRKNPPYTIEELKQIISHANI